MSINPALAAMFEPLDDDPQSRMGIAPNVRKVGAYALRDIGGARNQSRVIVI
jgi:hypothetical protein